MSTIQQQQPAEAVAAPEPLAANWSLRLQLRVMRLLLLHDRRLFRGQFRAFFAESALPKLPLFQHYDRYIRLLTLSDELLDDIMPRVRRQLSLQTNQTRLREEAPTRGDIDWPRTMNRGVRESPGLLPTTFDTRLRQRSSATPENILVVALLLAYRRELAAALRENLSDEALAESERQTLVAYDEQAERELAAAYARALLPAARAAEIDNLARHVGARLRPGPSPYRDLIDWWRRFRELRIGRTAADRALALAGRRSDEKSDAWLYELWIVLEITHLLHAGHAIAPTDTLVGTDTLQFGFSWNGRRFRLRYNRQFEATTPGESGWEHGPASRPDYTIEREQPLKVPQHGTPIVWREPPVVFDAKYYLRGTDPARTHTPIKKVLGDMLLLGAQHGGLFFPLLPEPPDEQPHTRVIRLGEHQHHGGMGQAPQMRLYHLAPDMPIELLQARLRAVLDYAADELPERPAIACHGVWLDADSINASRTPTPWRTLLCPKPHIGRGVYDLVDVEQHCLKDPRLCHVVGEPVTAPLVVRATTRQELDQQTSDTRARHDELLASVEQSGDQERAEQLRGHIFTGVGRAVEHYVRVRGNTAAVEELFERWVFGEYWREHPRSLSEESRRMLVSGEYVWQEYTQATLEDWAAPAIQFCRALEHELKRRTFHLAQRPAYQLGSARWTLGTPLHAYRHKASPDPHKARAAQHNWSILLKCVQDSASEAGEFESIMQRIENEQIGVHRNTLAHSSAATRGVAETVRTAIVGDRRRAGVLAWIVENLDPVM